MKDDAIRLAALAQAVIDAKEWRESFEEEKYQNPEHAVVLFGDDNCMRETINEGAMQGFSGWLRMPRDVAIEMMNWLEGRATKELERSETQRYSMWSSCSETKRCMTTSFIKQRLRKIAMSRERKYSEC